MSKKEIMEMNVLEYESAVQYCWETYTERRVLFSHSKLFEQQKGSGSSGEGFNIDWTELNPVSQELKKRPRTPPKKFLESLKNNVGLG